MFIRLFLLQKNNKIVAIELSKQKTLDADPKVMQQSNFTKYLEQVENTEIFLLLKKPEKHLEFFRRNRENVVNLLLF